jgi:hypothetical protein
VRELQNLIERAVIRSDNGVLSNPLLTPQASWDSVLKLGADFQPIEESSRAIKSENCLDPPFPDSLEVVQRQHILRVLERSGWVISGPNGAGAILNVHPNTLRSLMNRLGIRHQASRRGQRGRELSQPAQDACRDNTILEFGKPADRCCDARYVVKLHSALSAEDEISGPVFNSS